ncbi:MAG: Unknown protein [uncultured Thiotrichaceae bacterium]|uniref:SH3b domain-containing protein n=1 Tax=uncultured Thiotrichaceae bacterium TaxID=298394 RepID=A0A6S6U9M7_9GAMM|nr:MAG: Unknown protein [uncultured Thiotrichaceae bacterium]
MLKGLIGVFIICCAGGMSGVANAQDVMKVVNVESGQSLNLRAYPSPRSRIKLAIPHNASWLLKIQKSRKVGAATWQLVRWQNVEGWVNAHFLAVDERAAWVIKRRKMCMSDPKQTAKFCCGFPDRQAKKRFRAIKAFAVQAVNEGNTLALRSHPSNVNGQTIVAIPHNGRWITHLGKERRSKVGEYWMYARWNGQNGWLNKAFLRYDKSQTDWLNQKRKQCMRP